MTDRIRKSTPTQDWHERAKADARFLRDKGVISDVQYQERIEELHDEASGDSDEQFDWVPDND